MDPGGEFHAVLTTWGCECGTSWAQEPKKDPRKLHRRVKERIKVILLVLKKKIHSFSDVIQFNEVEKSRAL